MLLDETREELAEEDRNFHFIGHQANLRMLESVCNRSHIPTDKTVNAWPHLRRLQGKVPPLLDCEVGLLIGYDCAAALAPLETISRVLPHSHHPLRVQQDQEHFAG